MKLWVNGKKTTIKKVCLTRSDMFPEANIRLHNQFWKGQTYSHGYQYDYEQYNYYNMGNFIVIIIFLFLTKGGMVKITREKVLKTIFYRSGNISSPPEVDDDKLENNKGSQISLSKCIFFETYLLCQWIISLLIPGSEWSMIYINHSLKRMIYICICCCV